MSDILANITQIINNSPQVNTLVAGEAAAAEAAKRQGQMEQSRRQQWELQKQVLAMEQSGRIDDPHPDGRQRPESKRERQRRRRAQARAEMEKRSARSAGEEGRGCAASPLETRSIIDVCV